MDLLNVRTARSIWLFDVRDLNPTGLSVIPFFSEIKDRYHFLVWPKSPEELSWTDSSAKGIRFADGSFSIENQLRNVSVIFYNDGVIADTGSNTRDTDLFLQDLLTFAARHFGLECRTDLVHKKQYLSELMVRPRCDLGATCEKISKLADMLNAIIVSGPKLQWFGFELRPDPRPDAGGASGFKFEREVGIPAAQNRYYSLAPLPTDDHLRLLNEFEQIMVG